MKTEELKLTLLKNWGNIKDVVLSDFLMNVVNVRVVEHVTIEKNRMRKISYWPVNIVDRNVTVCVVDYYSPSNDKEILYRDVIIDDSLRPNEKEYKLVIGEAIASKDERSEWALKVQSGFIEIFEAKNAFCLNEDLMITKVTNEVFDKITFDVVNKAVNIKSKDTYDSPARFILDFIRRGKSYHIRKSSKTVSKDTWVESIRREAAINPSFASIANEVSLEEFVTSSFEDCLWMLLLLTEHPFAVSALKHEEFRHLYLSAFRQIGFLGPGMTCPVFLYESIIFPLIKEGSNLWECVGLDKAFHNYFSASYREKNIFSLWETKEAFNALGRAYEIKNDVDIERVLSLFGGGLSDVKPGTTLGILTYLSKLGYTIEELYTYLCRIETVQAYEMTAGLVSLYNVVHGYKTLDGRASKIFPDYLIVDDMVTKREIDRLLRKTDGTIKADGGSGKHSINTEMAQRVITNRKDIEASNGKYSVSTLSLEQCAPHILHQLAHENDYVLYKKSRGKFTSLVRLVGDVIVDLSESLDSTHTKHFLEWARNNNLTFKSYPVTESLR